MGPDAIRRAVCASILLRQPDVQPVNVPQGQCLGGGRGCPIKIGKQAGQRQGRTRQGIGGLHQGFVHNGIGGHGIKISLKPIAEPRAHAGHARAVPQRDMQDVVGGWITSALRVPSSTRKGVAVDVWVNDEGLLMNLPIRFVRSTDHSFLAGDLILSASNAGGETIPATEAELDDALSHLLPLAEPLINYSEML
jgi:hypothetical protein